MQVGPVIRAIKERLMDSVSCRAWGLNISEAPLEETAKCSLKSNNLLWARLIFSNEPKAQNVTDLPLLQFLSFCPISQSLSSLTCPLLSFSPPVTPSFPLTITTSMWIPRVSSHPIHLTLTHATDLTSPKLCCCIVSYCYFSILHNPSSILGCSCCSWWHIGGGLEHLVSSMTHFLFNYLLHLSPRCLYSLRQNLQQQ